MSGLYSHHAASQRPESSSSASPPSHPHFPASFPSASSGSGMLVVPQPINASKVIQDSLFFSELRLGHSFVINLSFADERHGRRPGGLPSSSHERGTEEISMQDVSAGRREFCSYLIITGYEIYFDGPLKFP